MLEPEGPALQVTAIIIRVSQIHVPCILLRGFFPTSSKTDPRTKTREPSPKSRAERLGVSQLLLIHQEGSSKVSTSKLAMCTC